MKKTNALLLYFCVVVHVLTSSMRAENINTHGLEKSEIPEQYLSTHDYQLLTENPSTTFAYVPMGIKKSIANFCTEYRTDILTQTSFFVDSFSHVMPHDTIKSIMIALRQTISSPEIYTKKNVPEFKQIIDNYLMQLESGDAHIYAEQEPSDTVTRNCSNAKICSPIIQNFLRVNSLVVNENAVIHGNLTVNNNITGNVALTFHADTGSAVTAGGAITIHGGSNINTTAAGSTVTVNLDDDVFIVNTLNLNPANPSGTVGTFNVGDMTMYNNTGENFFLGSGVPGAAVTGQRNLAFGVGANKKREIEATTRTLTNANDTIAIGTNSQAVADNSIGIGNTALSTAENSVAIGNVANATAVDSITIGNDSNTANILATGAVVIGSADTSFPGSFGPSASAANGIAIGSANQFAGAQANGLASIAIGAADGISSGPVASGLRSVALGTGSNTAQDDAIILGNPSALAVTVGIGTNSPIAKLDVVSTDSNTFPALRLVGVPPANPDDFFLAIDPTGIVRTSTFTSGSSTNAFITENGTAHPVGGEINIFGSRNVHTLGSGMTVTITLDDSPTFTGTLTTGNLVVTGTTQLLTQGPGMLHADSFGFVSTTSTYDHAVQIGNAAGTLTSIAVGLDGQVLLGATGADPKFNYLTSTGGTVAFVVGPNSLNLETTVTAASQLVFNTDSGVAAPSLGVLNVFGGSNINTTGAMNTVTINLDNAITVTSVTTDNLVVTGSATINNLIVTGTTQLSGLGAGVVVSDSFGYISSEPTTNHAVQIGNADGQLTSLPVGLDGQVLIGATGADPLFNFLTSSNNTIEFTTGPNTLDLRTSGSVASSFVTDNGTATPANGVLNIFGTANVHTAGSGMTVTITLDGSPTFTGTVTTNNLIVTGTTNLHLGAGVVVSDSAGFISAEPTTNHAVQVGNVDGQLFSLPVGLDGQVLIGATGADPLFNFLTSSNNTIEFTTGPNTLDLRTSGSAASSFVTDNGTATPSNGVLNIFGTANVHTAGSGMTVTITLDGSPTFTGTVTTNNLIVTGTTQLSGLGAGVVVSDSFGYISSEPTINHAVQVGNADGQLTSLPVGLDGQVLIGATGADPLFNFLTSSNNTIEFTTGPNTLDLRTSGSAASSFVTDNGTATPSNGVLNIFGTANVHTAGSGMTVTITLDGSPTFTGTVTTNNLIVTGTTNLHLGAGVVVSDSAGFISAEPTTNHAVQVGNVDGQLTSLPVGLNGQVLIGATGANPAFATLTSSNNSINFTPGPNSLDLTTSGSFASSFVTDNGTATPVNGVLDIFGSLNIHTLGSGMVVTITLDANPTVTGTVTSGRLVLNNNPPATTSDFILTIDPNHLVRTSTITVADLVLNDCQPNAVKIGSSTSTVSLATGPSCTDRLIVDLTGTVTIVAPATGNALNVTGNGGSPATTITGTGIAGALQLINNPASSMTDSILTINSSNVVTTSTFTTSDFTRFGNVVRVDKIFGNNTTGQRNGKPFLTITAALAVAQSGDTVWIDPGTYAESITIPSGVTIRGLSRTGVIISTSATVATDLVTMGTSSALYDVTLTLTSASHVQLRGIVFPSTTTATAQVGNVTITVDNSTAGAGTSNVYGVHSTGTGTPNTSFDNIRNSTITVSSVNSGAKRGILVDAANTFNAREVNIHVTNTGAGTAIGTETNNASASLGVRTSTISGSSFDISQTLGTITLTTTDLLNATANGLGFITDIEPNTIPWAFSGNAPGAGTRFMCVGTEVAGANPMSVRITQPCVVKRLSVQSRVASTISTSTWTVFRNGVATTLTATLGVGATQVVNNTNSVTFATGDTLSMQYIRGAGAGTQLSDVVVTIDMY